MTISLGSYRRVLQNTYVSAGEVAALEHELRDDAVEGRALVAETRLPSAQLSEVFDGLGDNLVVEFEVDATFLSYSTS